MHGLEMLDHTVQLTHEWINELDADLGWNNKPRTFRLMRAVFHALRDCLPATEAADLAAQLPTLLRGVFYEHYQPTRVHQGRWRTDAFLQRLNKSFAADPVEEDMADAANVVFAQLARRVSAGEIRDVLNTLPTEIREFWLA
ncbi:MAG TPA: DUF2267 domain-containing protein [Rhizomicrobium sp.]|nr:DUF2267 domain-containing protein [Rhizomicrobium sp.]